MHRNRMTDRDLTPALTRDAAVEEHESQEQARTRTHIETLRHQMRHAADQNDIRELHRLASNIEGAYDATGEHLYAVVLEECQTAAAVVHQTAAQGE